MCSPRIHNIDNGSSFVHIINRRSVASHTTKPHCGHVLTLLSIRLSSLERQRVSLRSLISARQSKLLDWLCYSDQLDLMRWQTPPFSFVPTSIEFSFVCGEREKESDLWMCRSISCYPNYEGMLAQFFLSCLTFSLSWLGCWYGIISQVLNRFQRGTAGISSIVVSVPSSSSTLSSGQNGPGLIIGCGKSSSSFFGEWMGCANDFFERRGNNRVVSWGRDMFSHVCSRTLYVLRVCNLFLGFAQENWEREKGYLWSYTLTSRYVFFLSWRWQMSWGDSFFSLQLNQTKPTCSCLLYSSLHFKLCNID